MVSVIEPDRWCCGRLRFYTISLHLADGSWPKHQCLNHSLNHSLLTLPHISHSQTVFHIISSRPDRFNDRGPNYTANLLWHSTRQMFILSHAPPGSHHPFPGIYSTRTWPHSNVPEEWWESISSILQVMDRIFMSWTDVRKLLRYIYLGSVEGHGNREKACRYSSW